MDPNSQQPKGRDGLPSALDVAIEDLNLAKENSDIAPAKAVFGSASVFLAAIKVSFLPAHVGRLLPNYTQDSIPNRIDCVELGLACADVCRTLDRGMNGRKADQFNRSVFEAIGQLTT
jgi:hypothetical protein